MGLSRMEINFRRLLNKCEVMLKTKQKDDDRLPRYVESLGNMLKDLEDTSPCVTSNEAINDYRRRIFKLKSTLGLDASESYDEYLEKEKGKNLSEREQLLGLRQRDVKSSGQADDLDELIDYHQNVQQKIADEMLLFTRNLKEQSELANRIIKKDTEVAGRSTQLTDDNFAKLKVESNKLTEHSKRAWKCWMWIMLVIVLVVFINMVLFMKVMKKKY
ncbi:hypothetical protein ILUMI_10046 [Ignelater luminosus]|uniref:Vesicle transport protein USE1 n=1 Tax=Ignelater luminosus TaxID=2038154 RepID=A0A8K0D404_IGNLU|nr:hypothetical protein ILUMI_10046 [Ignelater luminosus]